MRDLRDIQDDEIAALKTRLEDALDDVARLHREKMDYFEEKIRLERELSARPEAAEMAETLKRLRSQIPGCDCDNPAQCWESCGTLGHSEEHMKVIKDSNKP